MRNGRIVKIVGIITICLSWVTACTTQPSATSTPTAESNLPAIESHFETTSPVSTLEPILPTSTQSLFFMLTGKIAFASRGVDKNSGTIYNSIGIVDANGENLNYLAKTSGSERLSYPTWSPDGSHLAYIAVENDFARKNIYVWNINSNQTDLVKTGNQSITGLSWSPTGNQILFSGDVQGQRDIFVFDLNTKAIEPLINTPYVEDFPSWSPGGDHIAYLRFDLSRYGDGAHLFISDSSGQNQVQIAEILAAPSRVSWSPDGKLIAYRSIYGCGDIYLVEVGNGNLQQLTNLPGGEKDPVWSPDGRFIAFSASDFVCDLASGGEPLYARWQPYIVNVRGGAPVQLPLAEDTEIFNLSWLP